MDEPMRERTPEEQKEIEQWYNSCDRHGRLYPEDEECPECEFNDDYDLHELMFDAPGG